MPRICLTVVVWVLRTALCKTNAVDLGAVDDVLWGTAAIPKVLHQSTSDDCDVRLSDAERGCGESNILNEPANFILVKTHISGRPMLDVESDQPNW